MKTTIIALLASVMVAVGQPGGGPYPPNFPAFMRTNAPSMTNDSQVRAIFGIVTSNWSFNSSQLEAPVANTLQIKSGASLTNLSLVGLMPGTVARDVNVKQPPFNAKGDGSTDDSGAIQYALDYIYTNGSASGVYLPAGIYKLVAAGLVVHPNLPNSGSSGMNGTNGLVISGHGESTVIDARALTNGPAISFLSDGVKFFSRPYVHDFTIYGAGWGGTPNSNVGGQTNKTIGSGIFIGLPGLNAGTIGASYPVFERVKIMWEANGLVASNLVGLTMLHCDVHENMTNDILVAHGDSTYLESITGGTVTAGMAPKHVMLNVVGTGQATPDSGNGTTLTGEWECGGQAIDIWNAHSLIVEGGDVENCDAYSLPAFKLRGAASATFLHNYVAGISNVWYFDGPAYSLGGVTIINPDWNVGTTRSAAILITNNDGTLSFPKLIQSGNAGFWDTENGLQVQNCWFRTGSGDKWINLPDFDRMPLRNGFQTVLGGNNDVNWNLGVLVRTNVNKAISIQSYSYTNGTDEIGASPQNRTPDVGVLRYDGTAGGNWVNVGGNGALQAATSVSLSTAVTLGGAAKTNLVLDNNGDLWGSARHMSNTAWAFSVPLRNSEWHSTSGPFQLGVDGSSSPNPIQYSFGAYVLPGGAVDVGFRVPVGVGLTQIVSRVMLQTSNILNNTFCGVFNYTRSFQTNSGGAIVGTSTLINNLGTNVSIVWLTNTFNNDIAPRFTDLQIWGDLVGGTVTNQIYILDWTVYGYLNPTW